MTRRLVITIVAILAFLGTAALLWSKLFVDETEVAIAEPPDAAPVAVPPDAMQAPIEEKPKVSITGAAGTVEVLQDDGEWRVLEAGEELRLGDRIRTGDGAAATIDVAGTVLELGENGEVEIPELRRVDLGDGQITAKIEKGDDVFVVGTEGSDATAESPVGEIAVINDGKGGVAVASKVGKTVFKKAGKAIEIPEGKVSVATKNSGPSAPQAIPASLFLKVAGPGKVVKKKRYTLRGASTPGSIIRVNGELVKVGEDGTFQHVVSLKEGKNSVVVDSRDALGRRKAENLKVKVDSTGPALDGKVTW